MDTTFNLTESTVCEDGNFLQWVTDETKVFEQRLHKIWDETGTDDDVRRQRIEVISTHIRTLYVDVFEEARVDQKLLMESITTLLKETFQLQAELNIKTPVSAYEYENVPYYKVKIELEKKLKTYRDTLTNMQTEIKKLLSRERSLCHSLGKKQKLLPISPIPSQDELSNFKLYLEDLSNEKFTREEKFLTTKAKLVDIIEELKIKPSLDFEKMVLFGEDSAFLVTDENMNRLENYSSHLNAERESLISEVEELREKLSVLWERLEEDPQYISKFTEKYSGFSIPTCNALKNEIQICNIKVKQNIKIFVDKMRHEIRLLWDKCRFGPEEKKEFIHYSSDCFTEDLLSLHELQIEKLNQHFNKNKQIYDLIQKREHLWERMLDLERLASGPDRYKNRGGRLLQEEKERNSVRAQLPKIEKAIVALVEEYEKKEGLLFKIDGILINEKIARDWESHKQNNHLKLSAKKQARKETPRTPLLTPRKKSPEKRKLVTHLFGSSSAKKTKQVTTKVPKIQVNGSTIRRVSFEREKRLEKRRRSRAKKQNNHSELEVTDYDGFEMDLDGKPTCRSTLFVDDDGTTNQNKTETCATTPRRTTPRVLRHTPSRTNLPILL